MASTQGCAMWAAGLFWALPLAAQPAGELEMPSCVSGSPPLRVSASAERATLDRTDRGRFHEAAQARYPLYQRGGFVPAQKGDLASAKPQWGKAVKSWPSLTAMACPLAGMEPAPSHMRVGGLKSLAYQKLGDE